MLSDDLGIQTEIGTIRETYFTSCFNVKDIPNCYLALDVDFTTNAKKIPLWLFGFLY